MEGVQTLLGREAATSLLRWWRDAGVDVLVGDEPRAWVKASAPLPAGRRESQAGVPTHGKRAVELPGTIEELLAWLRDSADVPEAGWGRTRLLPSGDPRSRLMILLDMPEPGDAEAGKLLAGEVGELFDRMMGAIGRSRDTIWLASFASVRRVGRLSDGERERLAQIARHHIGLVAPQRLLIMGQSPAESLIGPDWSNARSGYHLLNLGSLQVETLATYTPGALNGTPSLKKDAWRTLQLLTKGLS